MNFYFIIYGVLNGAAVAKNVSRRILGLLVYIDLEIM